MTLNEWFQSGPLPTDVLQGQYNIGLVILSYLIAVLASYVALTLVGRLRAEKNPRSKIYWLVGGAFAMGAGIWSMHFIGMLAFSLPMPMVYDLTWTGGSLLIAILVSALALFILQKNYSVLHLALGGIFIGLGIAAMHYSGMEGMKTHVNIHYLPSLFFLSIGIAIIAAEAALWLALHSMEGSLRRQFYFKSIAALVMGVAISGMHYTGMAAAVFTPMAGSLHAGGQSINTDFLAIFIAGISALIISLALTVSTYYRKMISAVDNEKEFLNVMLENLEDGIIACDAEGKITVFNRALQKNIQSDKDSLKSSHVSNLYTPEKVPVSEDRSPLYLALNGEKIRDTQYLLRLPDTSFREVLINGQRIINSEGKILGAVAVIHDVTELKKTEKLKNEFVSIVSHELRTPLTSIRGALVLLGSGMMGEWSEKGKKLLEIASNNCERLLLLINDILDIEKIEAGKMNFQLKTMPLNLLLEESIEANRIYAGKYDLQLRLLHVEPDISVIVDPDRLMQVLANMISNASKFSPKGEEVSVNMQKIDEKIRVSVSDRGPGIPEEFHKRIFQKFSQADGSNTRGKGGTGLGLNISRIIIEKMGGTLDFKNREGGGTIFYFDLPIHQEKQSEVSGKRLVDKQRLLICEDDEDQSEYLKALLDSAGYEVDQASSVEKAKALLNQHEYQALLLDLILPDQDGIAFIRELRQSEKNRHLQIIVLSVIAKTGQALLNGDALSVVDWLEKPIDFNQLMLAIHRLKTRKPDKIPKILHIEDNIDTQHIVGTLLENEASIVTANSLEQARSLLGSQDFDLIILDLLLPDGNGVDILPLLIKNNSPILVFSETEIKDEYAKFVSQSLIKSRSDTETLLNTIKKLL